VPPRRVPVRPPGWCCTWATIEVEADRLAPRPNIVQAADDAGSEDGLAARLDTLNRRRWGVGSALCYPSTLFVLVLARSSVSPLHNAAPPSASSKVSVVICLYETTEKITSLAKRSSYKISMFLKNHLLKNNFILWVIYLCELVINSIDIIFYNVISLSFSVIKNTPRYSIYCLFTRNSFQPPSQ